MPGKRRLTGGPQYMGFVSFMILVWDHIITIGDEVRPGFPANRVRCADGCEPDRVHLEREERHT